MKDRIEEIEDNEEDGYRDVEYVCHVCNLLFKFNEQEPAGHRCTLCDEWTCYGCLDEHFNEWCKICDEKEDG